MASRAGARIKDLEYIQFHPTALSLPGTEPFLISEAVRGAGARLVNSSNIPFMDKYSPDWKDLAPRDVVTRAICSEMKTENTSNVFLNFFDYISAGEIENRFPTIYNHCRNYGVDITKELLPVAPASHFSCGGIEVDSWAQSSLQGFYALGECSCTGVHGANRLASTSLLEGVVWADRAVRSISENLRDQSADLLPDPSVSVNPGDPGDFPGSNQDVKCQIQKLEDEIQRIMWDKVGIIRNRDDLSGAVEELGAVKSAAEQLYSQGLPTEGTAGLRNMAGAAMVIAEAALWNRVSRGCHFVVS
jgi:L-aspartate oxidase